MEILTADDFKTKTGDVFELIIENGPKLELKLSSMTTNKINDFPGKTRDPFSLFFDGAVGFFCPQGTYRLRHPSGFEADIFLVPIAGNPDGGHRYQAVFT